MRCRLALMVLLPLLVVAACGGDDDATEDSGSAPSTTAPDGAAADDPLDGRSFIATSITEDGSDRALADGSELRLGFDAGRMAISGGCNGMGGDYTLEGSTLTVGQMAGTQMGCDQPLMDQDTWVASLFAQPVEAVLDGDTLTITTDTTVLVLTDRKVASPDTPLTGTTWTLTTIVDGDTASSVPGGVVATLTIAEDGSAVVGTGCNSGRGQVEVTDTTLTFEPLATTRMACTDEGATEVESAVLTVLDGEVAYTIAETSLSLTKGTQGLGYSAG